MDRRGLLLTEDYLDLEEKGVLLEFSSLKELINEDEDDRREITRG